MQARGNKMLELKRDIEQYNEGIKDLKRQSDVDTVTRLRNKAQLQYDEEMNRSQFIGLAVDELERLAQEKDAKKGNMGSFDDGHQHYNPTVRAIWLLQEEIKDIRRVIAYKQHGGAPASGPVPPAARVVMLPANIVDMKRKISEQERVLQGVQGIDARKTLETGIYALQTQLETALENHIASLQRELGYLQDIPLIEKIPKMIDIREIQNELEAVKIQVQTKFRQQQREQTRNTLRETIDKLVHSIESLEILMQTPSNPGATQRMERDAASKRQKLRELQQKLETI